MHNAADFRWRKRLAQQPGRNQLRIIGGKWRGRKIHFPDAEGLRPTADRIRETLFNWLAPHVEGSVCVDLFAGSGALGFEAYSRGAQVVVFVESNPQVFSALETTKANLAPQDTNITLLVGSGPQLLPTLPATDILFLDPPFNYSQVDDLVNTIAGATFLKSGAWIYLETAANRAIVTPSNWRLHRDKQAGQVNYRLYQRQIP